MSTTRFTMQDSTQHSSHGLAVDIISSIDGNDMLDVVLVANDGGEVPASRFVLGARSPVLQQALFNKKAVSSPELKLPYSTAVVTALVHYCRTNKLDDVFCQAKDDASVRELVKLCQCAVAFKLNGLETLVGNLASSICQVEPQLACAIYDEAVVHGDSTSDSLKSIALGFIRRNPEGSLLKKNDFGKKISPGGVSSLEAASLEQLLCDPHMNTEEITLFRAVMLWADTKSSAVDVKIQRKMDSWATQLLMQDRHDEAKKIVARSIDLSKIAPSDLMGVVSESGLVDEGDVSNALIQLALRLEQEGADVSKRRGGGVLRKKAPPPPPAPLPQIVYCTDDKESTSVDEILGRAGANTSGSSKTYEHFGETSKRKPKKQEPKAVTPQRKPTPHFATPDRKATPEPERLVREPSRLSKATSSTTERKKRGKSGVGSEIRKAIGIYLRDKVDSMCVHPKYDTPKND